MKNRAILFGMILLALAGCKDKQPKGENDVIEEKPHKEKKVDKPSTEQKVEEAKIPHQEETFWLGADISWETEMEKNGQKLYNYTGDEAWECTALMKDLGLNAVRLRVWVDPQAWELQQIEHRKQLLADKPQEEPKQPEKGKKNKRQDKEETKAEDLEVVVPEQIILEAEPKPYSHVGSCDKEDLLAKALRAKRLGMEVMVDFHYSDNWADPDKQPVPLSWKGHSYEQMKADLSKHTIEVLQLLKDNGIEPKWVQIGNETSNGLLWSVKQGRAGIRADGKTEYEDTIGHIEFSPEQYAGFINAGNEAVKSVFPNAITIVHLDNGWDYQLYERNLGVLEKYGAKYDMIGMSLYPYWALTGKRRGDTADNVITDCINNIKKVSARFKKDVMIVETGFEMDENNPEVLAEGRRQLQRILKEARYQTNGHCKGVFYWEPECRPSKYKLGAFTSKGRPSEIMQAWKTYNIHEVPNAE